MPLYEYECEACGQRTEVLQRFSDPPLASCPECGGTVRRLLSAPAVQFKGSGWYVTDYGGKGRGKGEGDGAKKSEAADASAKSSEKPAGKKTAEASS